MALAERLDGVIINCDSLQIYDGLPILTAQPSPEDKAMVPHRLYAHLHPDEVCSAGNWREMAEPVIQEVLDQGKTPIVCGGTGLYIKALMEGLSPMPDIPEDTRAAVVAHYETVGAQAFYDELKARDPIMAERFHVNHKARLIRAMEVLEATGKSLADWQALPKSGPPADWHFEIHKVMPPRDILRERCDARFDHMIAMGVLDEVRDFGERLNNGEFKPGTPITKSLGFKPLWNHLQGDISLENAIEQSKAETRQYAKRQVTWFRNQL